MHFSVYVPFPAGQSGTTGGAEPSIFTVPSGVNDNVKDFAVWQHFFFVFFRGKIFLAIGRFLMGRGWNGERFAGCILGLFTGIMAVILIVIYCRDTGAVTATMGTLADKGNDFSGRRVIVTNVGTGKRVGRYIFYDTADATRHCVVFALADAKVEPAVTTLRGYCVGVFDERIPGCPHSPPFLYIASVRPIAEADP